MWRRIFFVTYGFGLLINGCKTVDSFPELVGNLTQENYPINTDKGLQKCCKVDCHNMEYIDLIEVLDKVAIEWE